MKRHLRDPTPWIIAGLIVIGLILILEQFP